jgi:Domain of Unknown Function (DUF1259)
MQIRAHRRAFVAGSLGAVLASSQLHVQAVGTPPAASTPAAPDWQAVSQSLGAAGKLMTGDVFRIGMPRSDLRVTAKGVALLPAFALGGYAAFKQEGAEAMVMGDLVLLDAEVNPVLSGLFQNGFIVSGIHNHLNEMDPHVMYMHVMGMGDALALAQGLRKALSASATPLGQAPAGTPAAVASPTTTLPTDRISQAIGRSAAIAKGGVVQFSVPRAETITEDGIQLLPAMGVTTVLNFQPLDGGQAAITGDFVMVGPEVNPVAQALRGAGIDVTALHNHHLGENPRLFYMHFFATGDPVQLAQGLRGAVDKTNSKPA